MTWDNRKLLPQKEASLAFPLLPNGVFSDTVIKKELEMEVSGYTWFMRDSDHGKGCVISFPFSSTCLFIFINPIIKFYFSIIYKTSENSKMYPLTRIPHLFRVITSGRWPISFVCHPTYPHTAMADSVLSDCVLHWTVLHKNTSNLFHYV